MVMGSFGTHEVFEKCFDILEEAIGWVRVD